MTDTPVSPSGRARPLSPHLQIYRPQLTSVLSILHRATGVALTFGLFVMSGWIISAALGPVAYAKFSALIGTPVGILLMVGFSWALFYHLGNGIRHLFWDAGYGLELDNAYRSGWTVVILSVLLTGLCWGAVYYVKQNKVDFSQRMGLHNQTSIPAHEAVPQEGVQ